MNLEEIVVWYQKKIGTYDKQEWEKTIEQKILNSFTNITLKSAKLKTEFIDVDLVRGSSFPKAKPKQSLLTVIRLAIFRYLFLPFYKKWWVSQTSSKIYNIFLILYIGQICNWFIYIKNYNSIDANNNEQIFSISELIIPTIISYILCLIHSFIVSTNSMNNSNTKNKQLFSKNGKLREKIRRRKKIVRNIINVEITAENIKKKYDNNNIHRKETTNLIKKIHINENDNIKKKNLKIKYKKKDDENNINSNDNKQIQKQHQENNNNNEKFKVFSNQKKLVIYNISNTSNNNNNNDNNDDVQNTNKISSLDNNNYNSNNCINNYQLFDNNYKENDYDLNNSMNYSSSTSSNNNMKRIRNVNWDSPIHNYENNDNSDIIIIDNNDSKNLFNTNNYNCNLTSTTITITTTTLTSSTMTNSKLNEKQNSNNIFNMKLSSSSSSTNKLTKTPTPTTTTTTTVIAVAAPAPAAVAAIYSTTTTSISSDINGKNQTNNSSSRDGSSSSSSSNSSNSSNSSSNCSSNNIPTTYCNNDNSNSSSNSSNNIIINNILNTTIVSSSSSSSSSLLSSSISIKTAAAATTTTTIATNSINSISSINTTPTTTKTKATATTTTIKNDDNNDLKNLLEPFNKDDGFESLNGKSSSGDEDNKYDDNNDNILNLNNYDLINQQQQQQLSKKLSQQQQQQDIIYNKKFDIICRKKNSNSNSNKNNKINSYSSSNDNTPLVQLKLKNQRKKIKFCKNRSLLTSSVNNIINDNHYNYHNHHHNHHHHDNNYENYNSDNDKNDVVDDDDDDDDDELSDEELFKSNFDKLNKRYSIPLVRNSKRKLPYSEMELNNPSSILNLQNAYMKAMANTATTTALIKKSYSSTAEISSMATGTNGCNDGSVAKCDIVLGIGGLRRRTRLNRSNESSDIDEDGDDEEIAITNQNLLNRNGVYNGCSTSATEWLGITTNSEECSYSSEPNSDLKEDSDDSDHESAPNVLLNSRGSNDRISCTIWHRHDPKKAEMSVLDISSCIIERVEAMPESSDYIYIGVVCSIVLSLIPSLCRLCEATVNWETSTEVSYFDVPILLWEKTSFSFSILIELTFGKTSWEKIILIIGFFERLILTLLLFFLFAVAERTFKQRFLYAKLFSHLTSSRRARKSDLPHFRLNKVRNIKTWLSVRSYLKRRGPQRSVDVIVSTALSITLLLLGFLSVECLKDSVHIHSQVNLEALFWSGALGIYLLRFMTLGNKINRKYRSISVLITEQINLYLQIEQKPKKKDELMVANSVLKLAADLLKELESPFKISGLFANPYLYTTIKVVILSAFSGVLSEMLGFKLKLHKIKIK